MRFPLVKAGEEGLMVDENCPLVRFTVNGEQILENTPLEVPVNWNAPETMEMMIARMVRHEVSAAAGAAGYETLDEAYDFDTPEGDEYEEHLTPAELHAMMHAPEMKEERVRERAVREGAGSDAEESGKPSAGAEEPRSVRDNVERARNAGDAKGFKPKAEKVRRGSRSESGDGEGVGDSD